MIYAAANAEDKKKQHSPVVMKKSNEVEEVLDKV
jgi:hypothetical protein